MGSSHLFSLIQKHYIMFCRNVSIILRLRSASIKTAITSVDHISQCETTVTIIPIDCSIKRLIEDSA